MALKSFRIIAFLVLLSLSGCVQYPSDRYRSLEDYRRELPRGEIALLAKKKILTLDEAQKTALKGNPDYRSACLAVAGAKYR